MVVWRSRLWQVNSPRSHKAERRGEERCGRIGRTSSKIGEIFARIAAISGRIRETFVTTDGNCGTIDNPVRDLDRCPKIAMTCAKTSAISEMITGISGMTAKTGGKTAETYGMVPAGREAIDGRPARKTKSRQGPR